MNFSVVTYGQYCDVGVVAPCIIEEWTPSPVNPAYLGTAAPFGEPSTCISSRVSHCRFKKKAIVIIPSVPSTSLISPC